MTSADSLLSMSRAELVTRASGLGVEHADRMTRPELRDEILRRTKSGAEAAEARGLFGMARSMLASMMETGLKMPDAAALIRGTQTLSAQVTAGTPVATVTLAEIYAAQGHPDRALAMVDRVLESEPDHPVALSLRERLVGDADSGSTGLAVRSPVSPPVLETTGEEIRTGEPPPVEAIQVPVGPASVPAESPHVPAEPTMTPAESAVRDPGDDVRESLALEARGSQLIVSWALRRQQFKQGLEQVSPAIVVVGFQGKSGRPGTQESRVPLTLDSARDAWSGLVRLDGFFGAAASAALGFFRGDQFVPITQSALGRKAWDAGADDEKR